MHQHVRARGASQHPELRARRLGRRGIDECARLLAKLTGTCRRARHPRFAAGGLSRRWTGLVKDRSADGVLTGEESSCECFVDNDDVGRRSVGLVGRAPAEDRNAQGLEVVGAHDAPIRKDRGADVEGLAWWPDRTKTESSQGQRHAARSRDGVDARELCDPRQEIGGECLPDLVRIAAKLQIETHRRDAVQSEPRVDDASLLQRAAEEECRDEQEHRHRHLHDDERVTQSQSAWPAR